MAHFQKHLYGIWAILLILSLGVVAGRGNVPESAPGTVSEPAPESRQVTPGNPVYHDYARLIAGLSNQEGTLATWEQKPAWVQYARSINQSWEKFDQKRLAPMREWAAQEVAPMAPVTVFYPFSGPDFVNAHVLFPQAKTYLLVALEPVGELPDLTNKNDMSFFSCLTRSLFDLLHLDFFITAKMRTCLGNRELKGTLPVLLFFLAREQTRVLEVRHWLMKEDGTVEEAPGTECRAAKTRGIEGVRIVFTGPDSSDPQTLYYFRFNLANDSWRRNQHFVSFLKSFGQVATFAKAASYLMFNPGFSDIRQFILDQSLCVLQGDSAIPLKAFDPARWNFRFYGAYVGPINLFRGCAQRDLAEAYRKGKDVYPLPFGIDYQHRKNASNLLFAIKKELSAAAVPD